MLLRLAILLPSTLLGLAAAAGEPVALEAHHVYGGGDARVWMARSSFEAGAEIDLRFGPSASCDIRPLADDEFWLELWAPGVEVDLGGRFTIGKRGRVTLSVDPAWVGSVHASLCRLTTPEVCEEALEALEPRLVSSRLRLRPRAEGGETRARFDGRLRLELIDPATGEAPFAWNVSFRNANPMAVFPWQPVCYPGGVIIRGPGPR